MPKPEEDASRQRLFEIIDKITEFAGAKVGGQRGWPEYDHDIDRTIRIYEAVRNCDSANVPYQTLERICSEANSFLNFLKTAHSVEKRNFGENLTSNSERAFTIVLREVPSMLALNGKDALIDTLSYLTEVRTRADKTFTETAEKMSVHLTEVEKLYSKAVIAKHQGNFAEEAKSHHRQSLKWLVATGVFASALIAYGEWWVPNLIKEYIPLIGPTLPPSLLIQVAVGKIVVVSLLTYAMVFCSRNFSAHRHNHTVNVHRRNALGTFESFVDASSEKQTKEALLLEAAQAVFKPQRSGYLKGESEPTSGNQIVEIFRDLASEHKSG